MSDAFPFSLSTFGIAILIFLAMHKGDREAISSKQSSTTATAVGATTAGTIGMASIPATPARAGEPVLTVSGYVIPRERVEISPKFM